MAASAILVMGMIGSFGGLLIACVVEGPAQFWGSIVVAFIGACVLIGLLPLRQQSRNGIAAAQIWL